MDFRSRAAQGSKEGKTLDMIHVQMREQDVNLLEAWRQTLTQISDPGPGIQNKESLLRSFHRYTGSVSAIAGRVGAG